MTELNRIEQEALGLDHRSRAELAERLLRSLDDGPEGSPENGEIQMLWAEEAVRRDREIESGEVETIPYEEVLREAKEHIS